MRFLSCLVLALCGCGSSSGPGAFDLSAPVDLGSARDGAVVIDMAAITDASALDAPPVDPLVPHPPPGATRCGHGTLSMAQAAIACATPSFALDSAEKLARRCDGASVASVEWEVDCFAGGVYVWARFDQLTATAKYPGCMGFISDRVVYGWDDLSDGNGGHGGGMTANPAGALFDEATRLTVTASASPN